MSSSGSVAVLNLHVADVVQAEQWDNEIRALGGCLFHSHAWSEFRSVDSTQPLFFRWTEEENDELVGLAMGIQRPPPTSRLGRVASQVLIDSPPATARQVADFLTPLGLWAMRQRRSVGELQLGSFDARGPWAATDPPRPAHRYEFLFPSCDPVDVLQGMRKGTRSSVKRAQRLGVEVRVGGSSEDLLSFAQLCERTAQRLSKTKGLPPMGQPPRSRAAALAILVRRGAGRLYMAFLDGDPIAGCFFGIWDSSAYYMQSGANDRARDSGAVHLVLHRAISDFMVEDFSRVNLGGVSAEAQNESSVDHGIYNFKLGLGTEALACTGGSLVIRPHRARAIAMARSQRTALRMFRDRLQRTVTTRR
jgi:Acetyltransferase (GNAT) domain